MASRVETLTLLDTEGGGPSPREVRVAATVDGESAQLSADDVARELGWRLEPEGLCRGALCVPVPDAAALASGDGLDLAALAQALGRPLALDLAERAAALGASAAERTAPLARLEAPDVELPDAAGRLHRLSDHRGSKVLLTVHSSW